MVAQFPLTLDEFEPVGLLGSGGFGHVWQARQKQFDRNVAIKVGHQPLQSPDEIRRFERECKALGRLTSVTTIVDVYSSGITNEDRPFLVMEYIDGGTLRDAGQLNEQQLRQVAIDLCSAIENAHRQDVLHRDLKPANVFLRSDGHAVVGDFGIARLGDRTNTTNPGVTATVAYAAPETLQGQAPDELVDIYGIGVTLATAAMGRSPFVPDDEPSVGAIINRILNGPFPQVSGEGISPGFASTIQRSMAQERSKRPTSAAELRSIFETGNHRSAHFSQSVAPHTDPRNARPKPQSAQPMTQSAQPNSGSADLTPINTFAQVAEADPAAFSDQSAQAQQQNPSQFGPGSNRSERGSRSGFSPSAGTYAASAAAIVLCVAVGLFLVLRPGSSKRETVSSKRADTSITSANNPTQATDKPPAPSPSTPSSVDPPTSQPTPSSQVSPTPSTQIPPAQSNTQRIRFQPGRSSAVVTNQVVPGQQANFLLAAQAQQQLQIQVQPNGLLFEIAVIGPSGQTIFLGRGSGSIDLPSDGDYRVLITPNQASGEYTVSFAIF